MVEAAETVDRMAEAASTLVSVLSPDESARVRFPMSDETERRTWYYTPNERNGLPLSEMQPLQQQAVHRLVATGLSRTGYTTATTIMSLENTLDLFEDWRAFNNPDAGVRGRDPNRYYVAIFGEPGGDAPWGWRFDGHHVVVQYTIVDGNRLAPTPSFFGANPAESEFSGPGVLRPLAGEEDLARALLDSFDDGELEQVVISEAPPDDIVTTNEPELADGMLPQPGFLMMNQPDTPEARAAVEQRREALGLTSERLEAIRYLTHDPKGLAAAAMNISQRELLQAVIDQYLDRLPDEVAEAESDRVADVIDSVHFAWAGGFEHREPHYYRLQGDRLLIEYDNTQNDANHIHSVWRDPEGDFGADLLARHYAEAH
jgi:hypothetical protein